MAGNALRSLTPDDVAELRREIEQAECELQVLRDRRSGHVSSLGKVELAIGANERALLRLRGLLDEATT